MRQRFYKIIVVLIFTAFGSPIYAQNLLKDSLGQAVPIRVFSEFRQNSPIVFRLLSFRSYKAESANLRSGWRPLIVADDQYTRSFGFFCRQELQFKKRTGVPLRFRLGSLEHCDFLENKQQSLDAFIK